jgi:hypothetical protein
MNSKYSLCLSNLNGSFKTWLPFEITEFIIFDKQLHLRIMIGKPKLPPDLSYWEEVRKGIDENVLVSFQLL